MTSLLNNRKNMKNLVVQYKLMMVIKNLQNENIELKQKVDELQYEVEELKDNVDAKKLILYKN